MLGYTTRALWRNSIVFSMLALALTMSRDQATALAQGGHQFLGPPRATSDRFSPKHKIRYNTQGFDDPRPPSVKKIAKWQKKKIPASVIEQILDYPGDPDAIGRWIDQAYDDTLARFKRCSRSFPRDPRSVGVPAYVTIMPTEFDLPEYAMRGLAGVYIPARKQILSVNIYYIWGGAHRGWLRHARDIIRWEMENFFGVETGIVAEPRSSNWPCDAQVYR